MIRFKNIPDSDKPRERLYSVGSENLSNEELLSIIINTGTKDYSVKEVALKVLELVKTVNKLNDIGINTLMSVPGIGKAKAIELKAAFELGKRIYMENDQTGVVYLNRADLIYDYFKNIYIDKLQELFYCVYLDTKGKLIDKKCLFVGTINNSIIHPREIFKEAYLLSANSIICVHNHPSGDPTPSKEDILVTQKLREIGILHGIRIIDHVVIGKNCFYSFFDDKKM